MRLLKIMLAILVLGSLAVPMISCGADSDKDTTAEDQIATVERGNLSIEITAAGNLALSRTEDLAIDLFYQKGTVAEVLVEKGDTVKEGQEIVKLDIDEWNDELKTLEKTLTTAQRNLTTKEIALNTAERLVSSKERTVTAAERTVITEEFDVRQAQLNLNTAEYNLSQIAEVKAAQDNIDDAEYARKFAISILTGDLGGGVDLSDYAYWSQLKTLATDQKAEFEDDLADLLSGTSITVSNDVALQVATKQLAVDEKILALEDAELDVEDAKQAVKDAQLNVDDARQTVVNARLDVEDAKQTVEDAQVELDEAKSLSPIIVAPFDGFIPQVNVEGGDEVLKGTVAVQIADPNKFEANILVSEIDILQVINGGEAVVDVDAIQGMTLHATVTNISPTATIQQGVVNYEVKVEIQSLEAVAQERQTAGQQTMRNLDSGQIPERLQQAIDQGQITREQVDEMIKQRQAGAGQAGQIQQAAPTIPDNFQLREGLTVTVTIIVDERNDVLLIPNAAVSVQGMQSYVQVTTESGETEQRAIETGISDWQFTEVTEGLNEGEQILVPQGTATASTTPSQEQGGGMAFFGGGRPPR
ncbi:HlyD family efflux transporter periplasmic adaptor subunit [Chloroflexota bacterium]